MVIKSVLKRDGVTVVDYNRDFITKAIEKACLSVHPHAELDTPEGLDIKKKCNTMANEYSEIVEALIKERVKEDIIEEFPQETIQNIVEEVLVRHCVDYEIAKNYITYRHERENMRKDIASMVNAEKVMTEYLKQSDWRVNENASVNYSVGGLILHNSGTMSSNFWLNEVYTKEIRDAHVNADFHIHDLCMLAPYCSGWSLHKLIEEGFGGVEGKISSRPAKHLSTLINQMVNFIGVLQNEWAGAQAFSSVDTYLAPFVRHDNLSYKEVKQNIQSLLFGLNISSRWGCVDEETKVLTPDGPKGYWELNEGDEIFTYNLETRALELKPIRAIVKKKNESGKMHVYGGRGWCQVLTDYHRCVIKRWNSDELEVKTSSEIFDKEWILFPSTFDQTVSKGVDLSDEEIQLAAMVYTDGSVDMRNGSVHKVKIFKSDRRTGVFSIKNVLDSLGLEYSHRKRVSNFTGKTTMNEWTLYGDSARRVVDLIGGSRKEIDKKFLKMNRRQARVFLYRWASFDGDEEKMRFQYDTDEVAQSLHTICAIAGYTSLTYRKKKTRYVKAIQFDFLQPKVREVIDYDGIVWCPNTENGTAVFLRDGNTFISGNSQSPFSNFTFDLTCPKDLRDHPVIIGGKMEDTTYGEYQKEMDMINKAFIELYIEGDANGRAFAYPIPTYNLTRDFDWDSENSTLLFKMAGKYGIPYFQNFINSDLDPSHVRSMCPLTDDTKIIVKTEDRGIVNAALRNIVGYTERGLSIEVWTGKKWVKAKPNIQDKTAVIEITTSNGKFTKMGINHLQPVRNTDGTLITKKASDLSIGDLLPFNKNEIGEENIDYDIRQRPRRDTLTVFTEDSEYVYYTIVSIRNVENEHPLYCLEVEDDSHLFTLSNGLITHNCRLRLDKRELLKRGGGLFGANEFTGSLGVVTINLPRLGYLSAKSTEQNPSETEDVFFRRLTNLMDIARDSLEIKRKTIDKLTKAGLFPYTKRYLNGDWSHHFSTIGILGMNECCLNIFGKDITSPDMVEFAKKVLLFMRDRISKYQEETGNLYNLESTPGEGCSYRFAKCDKKEFGDDIYTCGETDPYYTNSTHLPVDYIAEDIFDTLDHQDELQTLYTGGTVHHVHLGESIDDSDTVRSLVKGIAYNYRLPYFTLSPVYSVCKNHGYLKGEVEKCPKCDETTEVYARIVGYYRKTSSWNKGKVSEFNDRKEITVEQLDNTIDRIEEIQEEKKVA